MNSNDMGIGTFYMCKIHSKHGIKDLGLNWFKWFKQLHIQVI